MPAQLLRLGGRYSYRSGKRSGGSPYPERTPGGHKLGKHLREHRDAATRIKEVPPEMMDDVMRQKPLRVDSDGATVWHDAQRNVTVVKNASGEVIMARRGPPGKPR